MTGSELQMILPIEKCTKMSGKVVTVTLKNSKGKCNTVYKRTKLSKRLGFLLKKSIYNELILTFTTALVCSALVCYIS